MAAKKILLKDIEPKINAALLKAGVDQTAIDANKELYDSYLTPTVTTYVNAKVTDTAATYEAAAKAFKDVDVQKITDSARKDEMRVAVLIGTIINASDMKEDEKASELEEIKKSLITDLDPAKRKEQAQIDIITKTFEAAVPAPAVAPAAGAAATKDETHIVKAEAPIIQALKDAKAEDAIVTNVEKNFSKYVAVAKGADPVVEKAAFAKIAQAVKDAKTHLKNVPAAKQEEFYAAVAAAAFIENSKSVNGGDKAKPLEAINKELLTGITDTKQQTAIKDALKAAIAPGKSTGKKGEDITKRLTEKARSIIGGITDEKDAKKKRFEDTQVDKLVSSLEKYMAEAKKHIHENGKKLDDLPNTKLDGILGDLKDDIIKLHKDNKLDNDAIDGLAAAAVNGVLGQSKSYKLIHEDDYKAATAKVAAAAGLDKDDEKSKAFKASSEKLSNSVEKTSGFVRAVVGLGALAVLWNRIKAMFGFKEEPDPDNPEATIKKRPSVLSQIASGIAVAAAGFVAYKVAIKGQSFGDLGNDVGNYWRNLVSSDKNKPISLGSPSK